MTDIMYNFVKHTQTNKRFEDKITVTRNRAIGFPTQFYKDNGLDGYKSAVLFYDVEKNAIGIKPTNHDEAGKISINKSKDGYGAHLVATSFFKANRINTKKFAGRYDYKKIPLTDVGVEEEGSMFIIELTENKKDSDLKESEM